MMNLELLTYSARLFGADSLVDMSVKHAQTTMKNHFRDDYSCYHLVDYDPETGEVLRKATVQGYADESAWSRGQAWAVYGYTMMFRETGRQEFLTQAEAIAHVQKSGGIFSYNMEVSFNYLFIKRKFFLSNYIN